MTEKVFRKVADLLEQGKVCSVATVVQVEGSTPRDVGAKMIILEDGSTYGSIGGDKAEELVRKKALEALESGKNDLVTLELKEEEAGGVGMKCGGRLKVSIEIVKPAPNLILVGSGQIAASTAELAKETGFRVMVADPSANKDIFPEGIEIIKEELPAGLSNVEASSNTYVAIISRHEHDKAGLSWAFDGNPRYVGLMGSENRISSTFTNIKNEEGVSQEKLEKVDAPIGLDIGAETPEEIAVSIVAELIKVRRS